ncbi:MAG: hypothetical protein OXG46_06030 [Chloroflexi bacterium]|nr:hypothetical protein [Chloroflexota bacterium]MCY3937901.1 hypothetical protein [Chloroflexota bacterium]
MATLNAADLTLVIKATNDASKALKSVEGHLQLIVDAAAAANDAMAQIADTAAQAADAACKAVTGGRSSRSVIPVKTGIHTFQPVRISGRSG